MADLTIQRSDYGFYVQGAITNADGSVFNLAGYAVTFSAWEMGNWDHPLVVATAELVVATQGTWKYLIVENDFITAGEYLVAVRATKAGAQETTRNYTLEVKESP